MAKKDKKEEVAKNNIPEGFKCYKKIGGGSIRFPNRIIKSGQKFWIEPDSIPTSFKDLFEQTSEDYKAVVVNTNNSVKTKEKEVTNVAEKFEVIIATDENGKAITKGKDPLYNVVDEAGKVLNEKPLRKGKADELLSQLSV